MSFLSHLSIMKDQAKRNNIDVDVCILRTGKMDKFGFLNYGAANSCTRSAIEKARLVIVEINENMPRCPGGFMNQYIFLRSIMLLNLIMHRLLPPIPNPVITDTDRIIAEQIVSEIRDGACIQLGIGGMPNTVGKLIAASGSQKFRSSYRDACRCLPLICIWLEKSAILTKQPD